MSGGYFQATFARSRRRGGHERVRWDRCEDMSLGARGARWSTGTCREWCRTDRVTLYGGVTRKARRTEAANRVCLRVALGCLAAVVGAKVYAYASNAGLCLGTLGIQRAVNPGAVQICCEYNIYIYTYVKYLHQISYYIYVQFIIV